MNYRDLLGKQIGLIGSEKICKDIKEFFNELTYKSIVCETRLRMDTMNQVQDCDFIIVCFTQKAIEDYVIKENSSRILLLADIFRMIDELETFYIDKRYHDRTICVYGEKNRISNLIAKNPNLKIDYIIKDQITDEYSALPIVAADKVREL